MMADDSWQKVREIFDDALRRQPDERRKFIHEACGEDKTLLAEVESLLSSLGSAESFMETPAVAKVARVIEAETKKLERGKCFGHYEIVRQIGEGGMGEVYLAKDQKLDRQVAIKILNEQFSRHESNLRRFIQEAKSASALNHPNILVVHEVGECEDAHFIVSEFIKGKTLREILRESPPPLVEVLDIAIQTANALSAAHEAHLVHRDIKPENIMIRPDGFVKVLDFGLAKLIEQKNKTFLGLEDVTARQNQTAKGVILGTINYMSPEQARGKDVDARTDIWSLGVVLYEMLTGKPPFAGETTSDTISAILSKNPAPLALSVPGIPKELERIIGKTLRKNREERYYHIKELLIDLKDFKKELEFSEILERSNAPSTNVEAANIAAAVTSAQTAQTTSSAEYIFGEIKQHKRGVLTVLAILMLSAIGSSYWFFSHRTASNNARQTKSIAVLPLKPIGAANRDELYEVGIADSLIYKLSSMKDFIVRPLSATRKYADVGQDPLIAGREQQVDYVLASNYQLAGGKIRITAQLFNVAGGQIEETYKSEKDAGNIFALQDAVAGEVGNILLARFNATAGSPMGKRGTTNEEAYRLYLLGMNLYNNRNASDVRKAVEIFEQAIRLDPNYAQAWAGLAHVHRWISNSGGSRWIADSGGGSIHEEYQKSIESANKALALDENLSEAHSALCENKMYYEYDFAGAERECQRAVELDPNSSLAHQIYARYLNARGRFDESIAENKTAIDLDPASPFTQRNLGVNSYYARRYAESVEQLKLVLIMKPDLASAQVSLWNSLEMQGEYAKAFESYIKAQETRKADAETVQLLKTAYQTSGWQGFLRERIRLNERDDANYAELACLYARTGNKDKAFESLKKAYQRREWGIAYIQVEPRLDSLRDDPRFEELVRRVSIPQ